jgi:hypothetical protein
VEPNLQAAGVLGPNCQPGLPGAQSSGAAADTGGTKPVGSGSPGAYLLAAAANLGELSLQAVGVLDPDCQPGLPGAQSSSGATGLGDPSLQAARALGPSCWCLLLGAMAAAVGLGEPSLQVVGVLGPDCQPGLQGAQFRGAAASLGE